MSTFLSSIRWLDSPSETELERVNFVLRTALYDDPLTDSLVDGDKSLLPLKFESILRAAAVSGKVQVLSLGNNVEDIVGAAVWFGPGEEQNGTEEQLAAGGSKFLDQATEPLRSWYNDHFSPTMDRLADESLGPGFRKEQWYLTLFGVLPEHHRKGYARALMKSAEEVARRDDVAIVLETVTDLDVLIYGRMGFEVKGEVTVTSRFGSYRIRMMMKKP